MGVAIDEHIMGVSNIAASNPRTWILNAVSRMVCYLKIYDRDIRNLLYKYFLTRKTFTNTPTVVINELDVCANSSRIDIAVVNGQLHGYEIKSKQDTLERLSGQIEAYNKTFDTITIVGFENHIPRIMKMVPNWWGIKNVTEFKGRIRLRTIRKEKKNQTIDLKSIVRLLWKDEMIKLLTSQDNLTHGYQRKSRQQLSDIIVKEVNEDIIGQYIRDTLKTREAWKAVPVQQLNDGYNSMQPNSYYSRCHYCLEP